MIEFAYENGLQMSEELFYSLGGVPTTRIVEILNEKFGANLDPELVAKRKEEVYVENMGDMRPLEEVAAFARKVAKFGKVSIASFDRCPGKVGPAIVFCRIPEHGRRFGILMHPILPIFGEEFPQPPGRRTAPSRAGARRLSPTEPTGDRQEKRQAAHQKRELHTSLPKLILGSAATATGCTLQRGERHFVSRK